MNKKLKVNIKVLNKSVKIPAYQSNEASGFDLTAYVKDNFIIKPKEYQIIPTGLIMEIPKGYEGQIRPRSGLAAKNGITVLNSPGTIDSDYRGEIKIILINLGIKEFLILPGMRVAQMIISPTTQAELNVFTEIKLDTARGNKGFGSTGL
ncbi:dUTP diphosphatase [Pelagibacteraceae bacterium]|nr:dUTP diphosphatase [Pelagibacteraceae bacterium]